MTPATLRDACLFLLEQELGIPYRWAGDDPIAGFDCSGLVQEGLRAVGILPASTDYSAHDLLNVAFSDRPRITVPSSVARGMLVFWPGAERIRHVEMVWAKVEGRALMIGASGGGPATTSLDAAVKSNAYVKIHPLAPGWIAAVDPF